MADEYAFQSDAFQNDAFQTTNLVSFAIMEGADLASFSATSRTYAQLVVLEGPDVPDFNVISRTYASFAILEGPDDPTFNLTSTTKLNFNLLEGRDIPSFNALTGARFYFAVVEGADIPSFRTIAAFFTLGDADIMYVQPENNVIQISQPLYASVSPEGVTSSLSDENQRMDVDQISGTRRDQ